MFHERVPPAERVARRVDIFLDDHVGFHTLAVRHSLRHGFNRERWERGHPIAFLDIDRAGHLPRWRSIDRAMGKWLFSGRRYVPSRLTDSMRAGCAGLVVTNLQAHVSIPTVAARGSACRWSATSRAGTTRSAGVVSRSTATSSRTRRCCANRALSASTRRAVVTG
jgi:hypothetical protein